jgi:hypothetical protein
MKHIKLIRISLIMIFMLAAELVVGGQYQLSWFTIDSGGSTSRNDPYSLSGTIGQPDAAKSDGQNYELLGGFWAGWPYCIVNFHDYANFAEQWLETGQDLSADLHKDNVIDRRDLDVFTDYWLSPCPTGWKLK